MTNDDLQKERAVASLLRQTLVSLYDCGVSPIHAVRAMLHNIDETLTEETWKLVGIWLGLGDLLDRDAIETNLRSQLVAVSDVLAKSIEDSGSELKTFVTKRREDTRRINEMKFLQSYKLIDDAGIVQLELVNKMLADIEHERANNPGSLAQDISDEKLAKVYSLRDNWNEPSAL